MKQDPFPILKDKALQKGRKDAEDILAEYNSHMTEAIVAITEAFSSLGEYMNTVIIPQFVESMKMIYTAIYDVYLQSGAPYGKSKRGFNKWLKEMTKRMETENDGTKLDNNQT